MSLKIDLPDHLFDQIVLFKPNLTYLKRKKKPLLIFHSFELIVLVNIDHTMFTLKYTLAIFK
jgi:hypothetical protein